MTRPARPAVLAALITALICMAAGVDLDEAERTAEPLLLAHAVEVSHADDVGPFTKVIRVQDFAETRECYQ